MPVNKQGKNEAAKRATTVSRRTTTRKVPGTRAGTLEDWREGLSRSGKPPARRGTAIRDGR